MESENNQEEVKTNIEKVVDTTRTEHGKVVITEIVFDTTPSVVPDECKTTPNAPPGSQESGNENNKTRPTASINIHGVGQMSGNIKLIRQTVIEDEKQVKGKSKESEKQEESKCNSNAMLIEENKHRAEAPAPDPYRWRYAFYLVIAGGIALLYLKRVPILNWIKRILAGLRRIF